MRRAVLLLAVLLAACHSSLDAPASTPVVAGPPDLALFTHGVAAGDQDSTSAVLWTRTVREAEVIAEVSPREAFERDIIRAGGARTSAAHDFTAKLTVTGLEAGSRYFYRFRSGPSHSPTGSFRTAPAASAATPVTMAFSGDADWRWKPYPILTGLAAEKADFFLFLGDLIYESTNLDASAAVEDLAGYRSKYRQNREPRPNSESGMVPMRDLYASFGQYSIFDNHEAGLSRLPGAPRYTDGGAPAPGGGFVNQTQGFADRLQAYREYQPIREEIVTGGDAREKGSYRYYREVPWGRSLDLLILDDRSYRDLGVAPSAPDFNSCSRTMLGATQLGWAEQRLLAAKRAGVVWKLVVVSSPIGFLGGTELTGAGTALKSWPDGGYACERSTLLQYIDDNAIDNVVFLTTDNHYTVIDRLYYRTQPADPQSVLKPARNSIEVLTGPIGAGHGRPQVKVDTAGLGQRQADAAVVEAWNQGLRAQGLQPVGLDPTFPGLLSAGLKPGDFATFGQDSYAVLRADPSSLSVRIIGEPGVVDAASLEIVENERAYERLRPAQILAFELRAQG